MGGTIALAASPALLNAAPRGGGDPLARAFAAAGGRDRLARVRVVAWSGTAWMMLGKTPVTLQVESRIEPFARARSDSWLISETRDAARTVMIERDSAFLVQGGAQTTLPAAQARFERQRLGAFAYLLLAPAFVSVAGRNRLNAAREGYPPIALTLGRDGQIAAADYVLTAPAPGAPSIRQHFSFTGSVSAQGVRFPRVTTMLQDGRPSLRLTITDFSVELSPA
ncbi:hypothetical protein [Sphingomonas glacialis]|uniref:Uncharacterized protein n=1 Tax=Sphingomonas glacialis TaxID=658225 RepID=A0A502FXG1_9SPHN|nr:hypothetical protein [Sphingomonas glacialis]TPG54198.1 hypothetical protein EAH76_05785 [Sphingomonas glacialis]